MSTPRTFARSLAASVLVCAPALAAPRVATDIAPVHSIVARVMQGAGTPVMLVPPGASEHTYALRPSGAEALQTAEIVFWTGPSLTPWLDEPIQALAADARVVMLADVPGLVLLPIREGGPFEPHEDAHSENQHEESVEADAHAEAGHTGPEAHPHAGTDPHLWLDPRNAGVLAAAIAATLSADDPDNAAIYIANADAFAAELKALVTSIAGRLAPVRGQPFIVFHDAYQYFETSFGFPASGSIALSDAEAPSAQRIAEIRDRVTNEGVVCAFSEPQHDPKLVGTVIEGTQARTGTLDPIGVTLEPGAALYPALLLGLASNLADCLAE